MGIDSSIAMGVRPVQIESPMNALAQMMQIKQSQQANQLNTMKMDEYQRGVGETNRLNSLYSGAIGTDGKIDRVKLITGAASQNLGSKIPGLQKGFLETDESQGKVDKQKSELIDASLKRSRGFLDTVKTPEDYLAWHEANHLDPVLGPVLGARGITAASARASITEALQKPGGFQDLLNRSAMGIEKFSEMNKPSVHVQNLGGSSQVISTPGMGGAPTVLSNSPITQSADSVASNAQSNTNSLRVDARSRDATSATLSKPFEVTGPDGVPVLVQQSKDGKITPVTGYSPKTAADKPMNEGQSKAALFGSRMKASHEVLASLAEDGTTTSTPGSRTGFGVGAVLNTMSSAKQQQLNQAKRDFVNAVLRRESGAAIAESEFSNADSQYFPQVGDAPEVKKQKSNNRELAIRGILAEVPKSHRGVLDEIAGKPATPAGNPQDAQALQWANANPNDPRSAQIKKRLGQ
jgi:hypothetical protein